MLNNVMQISEHDHMWRSMIEMPESIQGVHGAMTCEIQESQKGGIMQIYVVITVR